MSICTLGNVKTRVAIEEGKCWRRSETSIESQLFVQGLDGICFLKNNSDIKERTKKKILINYTKSCTQADKMGLAVHNAGWGAGQSALGQRNSGWQRAVRTGSAQQLRRRAHVRAPGVNPKESTEPISGPSGGAHGYAVHGGGRAAGTGSAHNSYGRRECVRRLGSIPKKRLRARGGCSAARAGTQCTPGAGQCAHWVGATGTGGAHVRGAWGHTEEGVGPLGYAWCRVRPSRIGGASPGSERRGGTTNRRTVVLGAGSTCIPHGVGRCLGTRAARWAAE
ncbi:hypothetical protein B0H14DRAFT_2583157 [Mycena olivaceomarginata]|nr:hypothetical protein B0H14DRAFT_2583157 [Mycena olivaceomarginata]